MKLKEVFRLEWKRIVLALIILFVLFLIPMKQAVVDYTGTARGIPFAFYKSMVANVPRPPGMAVQPSVDFILWAFILDLIIWYVVASVVVFVLTKKKKRFQPI